MAEMVLLNPWMVRRAHLDGRQVLVWFGALENPTLMRLMLSFACKCAKYFAAISWSFSSKFHNLLSSSLYSIAPSCKVKFYLHVKIIL